MQQMAKLCKYCGHTIAEKFCKYCKILPGKTYSVRLVRALKSLNDDGEPHVVRDFNMLDKEEKAKIRNKHLQRYYGSSLIMAIRQRVKHRQRRELLQRAFATCHMLDGAELKEKYASKPDQLKKIFGMP